MTQSSPFNKFRTSAIDGWGKLLRSHNQSLIIKRRRSSATIHPNTLHESRQSRTHPAGQAPELFRLLQVLIQISKSKKSKRPQKENPRNQKINRKTQHVQVNVQDCLFDIPNRLNYFRYWLRISPMVSTVEWKTKLS